jgi:hypothetical protein
MGGASLEGLVLLTQCSLLVMDQQILVEALKLYRLE